MYVHKYLCTYLFMLYVLKDKREMTIIGSSTTKFLISRNISEIEIVQYVV